MTKKTIFKVILGGIVIGLIMASGLALIKIKLHGKFPVGTSVAGIELSRKTLEEGVMLIEQEKEKYLDSKIEISFNGKKEIFTPRELGVKIYTKETINTLNRINAKGINVVKVILSINRNSQNLKLITLVDNEQLGKTLNEKFKLKELAPVSAAFYFDAKSKLAISEEENGIVANTKKLSLELKQNAGMLKSASYNLLFTESLSAVTKEDLEIKQEQVKEELRHPLILEDPIYSDDWILKLTDHLDWVKFTVSQKIKIPYTDEEIIFEEFSATPQVLTMPEIIIKIDQEKLNEYIDKEISKWLDRPPEPVNIYKNTEGKIIIEGEGNNGRKVQRKLLKEMIELAVANKVPKITIPVIETEPEVKVSKELQDLGIKERISVGYTSYYKSSADRVHNIKTGSAKFNGLLIAPDEIFSFNKYLGKVDESTGYRKGLVIKKEGTVPEYGGGLCQVSTTMFRAALFAGLPLIERNEHSYAVSFYAQVLGHGLDATIFLGGADFKFKNDTGNPILIQTYVESDYELYIIFYGTSDGRSVRMEGPYLSNYHYPGPTIYEETLELKEGETKQVEKPHIGFSALWYRHLIDVEGNHIKEEIKTRYQTIPAKILVGTKQSEVP